MIVGAIVRVEWLSDSRDFTFIAAGVLLPLGLWLLTGNQPIPRERTITPRLRRWVWVLALVVGVVGGIYGIGGGSLLAPILIGLGFSVYEVAPATLAATFLTSIAGIVTYQVLQSATAAPSRPNGRWERSSVRAASPARTAARAYKVGCRSARSGACLVASPVSSPCATSRRP